MPKATLSGLIERRAMLAFQLDEASAQVAVLAASLRVIDGRIRRMGANCDPTLIKPSRLRLGAAPGERGPIIRPVLTILRTSEGPMTLRDITLRLMEQRGLDARDKQVVRNVGHQIKVALHNQRGNGVLVTVRSACQPAAWKISA